MKPQTQRFLKGYILLTYSRTSKGPVWWSRRGERRVLRQDQKVTMTRPCKLNIIVKTCASTLEWKVIGKYWAEKWQDLILSRITLADAWKVNCRSAKWRQGEYLGSNFYNLGKRPAGRLGKKWSYTECILKIVNIIFWSILDGGKRRENPDRQK